MNWIKKAFVALFFTSVIMGCADPVAVPSFVKVEGIYLDSTSYDSVGTTDSRIEYAWMYINNNLQGVYKVPFLVPVQNYGNVNIEIRAGIPQLQMIGGTGASVYPFYTYWQSTATVSENDTTVLKPTVKYRPGKFLQYKDDFEVMISPNNLFQKYSTEGIFQYVNNSVNAYEGVGYGELLMLESETEVVMANTQLWNISKNFPAYYIEMNFKCNARITVGVQTSEQAIDVVSYYATDEWKKVYIDVSSQVKALSGAGVRVYIKMARGAEETDVKWVWVDNFKFVY